MNTAERFWSKVDRSKGDSACWIWLACKYDTGYGQMSVDGVLWRAHRLSWVLTHGPIPDGVCVLHRCDNRPCVNPSHLFLGSRADNSADMIAKGRSKSPLGERSKQKTHCPKGHPYDAANTIINERGWRLCRTCRRAISIARSKTHRTQPAGETVV